MQKILSERLLRAADGATGAATTPATGDVGGEKPEAGAGAGGGNPDPSPASALHKPAGLPDSFIGRSDIETLDRVAAAFNDLRAKDSQRPRASEKADDYVLGELPAELKVFGDNMAKDPAFAHLRTAAMKHDIAPAQFAGFMQEMIAGMHASGSLRPEAIFDPKAELAKLVPDAAAALTPAEREAAAQQRLTEAGAFLQSLEGKGLAKEHVQVLADSLTFDAAGVKAVEALRSLISSGQSIPSGGAGQGITAEQLRARTADPRNDPNSPKFDRAFWQETQAAYQRLYS